MFVSMHLRGLSYLCISLQCDKPRLIRKPLPVFGLSSLMRAMRVIRCLGSVDCEEFFSVLMVSQSSSSRTNLAIGI